MVDISLEDRWDISYRIENVIDEKISRKIIITIKNHSIYKRKFKVYLKKANFKNDINSLRFKMYSGLSNPIEIEVDKYSKGEVSINIPRFNIIENGNITIGVINLDKNEEKTITINV